MKLDQVIIENFRQYFGKQAPLIFARSEKKNVTLIYGMNGAGKSNLFKAINWCIYGGEVLDDNGELTNKEAIKQARQDELIQTKVQVNFFHKGEKYLLSRCIAYNKKDGSYSDEDFNMMTIQEDGKTKPIDNPLGRINDILPENVRTYFLFDGEKIDNFSKPTSAADVKNAIYNVLKLEVLERGREHLRVVGMEYQKELSKVAGKELQQYLDEYEEKQKKEEGLQKKQRELENSIESARKKIKDIEAELGTLKDSRALQKERSRLEDEKKKRESELDKAIEQIRKIATSPITAVNNKMLANAVALLDSKRVKGEIPSNIRQQFLQDVVDAGVCICGRKFEKDGKEHNHLLKMQQKTVSGFLEEEVIGLTGGLRALINESASNMELLNERMKRQSNLRDEIDEYDTQISEISQQLKDSRSEDVEKLEKNRDKFKSDVDGYILEKGSNASKLEELSMRLKELDELIKKLKKEKQEEKDLANKMAIANKAADAINAIYQRFADDMRTQIEMRTKEIFDSLIWKDSQFKSVNLSSDYHLEVIDRWDRTASAELSAGERQILSLSFIAAMAKESGEEAPIVMDTPFGRLSSAHRESITRNIPELADQLVLFVTDEEMNDTMKKNLSSRVGERYQLQFESNTGCTTIERE